MPAGRGTGLFPPNVGRAKAGHAGGWHCLGERALNEDVGQEMGRDSGQQSAPMQQSPWGRGI